MPPLFSLITYITHIIYYLLSLMVTDIGPMDEIIMMVSIKLCPVSLQIHSQLKGFFCV